jgi:hypothetical protein
MDYQFDLQRVLNPDVLIDAAGARAGLHPVWLTPA